MNGLLHHLAITLKLNFRSKQAIIYGYVVPIFFLIAFGVVFATKPPLRAEMGQLITVTVLGGACFGMPTAMVAERERGVWRRYRLLPTAIGGIILSAMIVRFFIVLSAAVLQILLAHWCVHTPWPQHPWQMLGAFTFVCFSFLGLGLVIAMLADNVPSVQALGQAIFLPMIMIGGVGVPLRLLPVWVQHIAAFFPGRYAVQAIEVCQYSTDHVHPGLSGAHFDLLALTVIGVASLLAGAKMFRWDLGQKLTPSAKGWVAMAVVTWAFVGTIAIATGRLKSDVAIQAIVMGTTENPPPVTSALQPVTTRGVAAPTTVPTVAIAPTTVPAVAIAPTTAPTIAIVPTTAPAVAITPTTAPTVTIAPTTGPTVAIAPTTGPTVVTGPPPAVETGWQKITKEDIDSITYDDLPDDNSTNTPFAGDLNGIDDDSKKKLEGFKDALPDWAPGQEKDLPQRLRNLLSICAIGDVAEAQIEGQIPYVVFNYMRSNIQKDQLIKALVYVIINDKDGTVLKNVKDIKELEIDAEIGEEDVRQRSTLYAKKMLFRLLGKMPPKQN